MLRRPYVELLRYARRVSRRSDEAEDLLQSVLLAALEGGRVDVACPNNRRWIRGALRKRALFEARSAVRRRRRETVAVVGASSPTGIVSSPTDLLVEKLSPSLRTTALLVLTGHTKIEIAWLLDLSDSALRQRIAGIRKCWRIFNGGGFPRMLGPETGPEPSLGQTLAQNSSLRFGQIRRALLGVVTQERALLASHDPDGNLFVLCSQNRSSRQQGQQKIRSTSKKE